MADSNQVNPSEDSPFPEASNETQTSTYVKDADSKPEEDKAKEAVDNEESTEHRTGDALQPSDSEEDDEILIGNSDYNSDGSNQDKSDQVHNILNKHILNIYCHDKGGFLVFSAQHR